MTDAEINAAIADATGVTQKVGLVKRGLWYRPNACGYTDRESEAGRYTMGEAKYHESVHGFPDDVMIRGFSPPDYVSDLNAMRDAESTLVSHNAERYANKLAIVVGDSARAEYRQFHLICATAKQRAEAFLKTFHRWVDAQ
jgi:hypothetical protein